MGRARAVVEQWRSLCGAGRLDETAQRCQPDVEGTMPGGVRLRGPAEVLGALGAVREAFPDIRHRLLDAGEAGAKVALEPTAVGTYTGTFRAPQGDAPPTGRTVVRESVDTATIRDGRIAPWRTSFDQMAFLAQLGPLPEPATA